MKELHIAETLAKRRREMGVTQEALAAYLGVTKASVSKWETGQSYPDLILLPQLATYFNLSVDELIGYRPQMTREAIHREYRALSQAFAQQPFEQVLEDCRTLVKRYYSCFPLLYQMATLLINHADQAQTPGQQEAVVEEAMAWLGRVREEGDAPRLCQEALYLEAFCLISLGRPKEALVLLEDERSQIMPPELLAAGAYQMVGETERALEIVQGKLYSDLVLVMNGIIHYMGMLAEDPMRLEESLRRVKVLAQAFDLEKLHPILPASAYLQGAHCYMRMGRVEDALAQLEETARVLTGDIYPIRLHGDAYFDRLDAWLAREHMGETLPRAETLMRSGLVEGITASPAFAPLADNARFRAVAQRLAHLEQRMKAQENH